METIDAYKAMHGLEIITLDPDFEAECSHEIYCYGQPSEFSKFEIKCQDIEHAGPSGGFRSNGSTFYGENFAGTAKQYGIETAKMSQFIRRELCDDWTLICAYIVETLGVDPSEIVSVEAG
jgi:hypothetical protein